MNNEINHPVLKVSTVGVAWFTSISWGELASVLAAIYTTLLILEWVWKKAAKPLLVRLGYLKTNKEDQ